MINIKNIVFLFSVNILITIVSVVIFYSYNDTKELILLSHNYETVAVSDQENQGNSISELRDNNAVHCFLTEGFITPYCAIKVKFTNNYEKGLNFDDYESLMININFTEPKNANNAPRIYVKNYNDKYSDIKSNLSMKFNGVQLNGYVNNTLARIDLDKFQVADWWIENNNIPVKYAGAELNNVIAIQFESGTNAELGNHFIEVKEVKLQGNWLDENIFVYFLVFWWATTSIGTIAILYIKENKEIIKLKSLNKKIIAKSNKDELTGVYNRHAIKSFMKDKDSKFNNSDIVSCVYIDIDFFKRINDNYGHTIGDKVLIQISTLIQNSIRKSDYFSRWGGEEFALFCLDSSAVDTKILISSLRSKINSFNFAHGDKMTCSFGITEMKKGESFMEAFDRADKALYEAKNTGRDKIVIQ